MNNADSVTLGTWNNSVVTDSFIIKSGDLSSLLDDQWFNKMGAGAVIGIIIVVLLVVKIIAYGGYYLYKKM